MKVLNAFAAAFAMSFALPLIAQNEPTPPPAACGDLRVSMAVNLDKAQQLQMQPEPGEALIYFIQDAGTTATFAYPTTKIGIDGKWVGANKKSSFFAVNVAPGEHHLCVAVQSSFVPKDIELAHLTVEAGKVYYYRTRIIAQGKGELEYFSFMPVDSDEAEYLTESFPTAQAHPRK